MRKIKCSSPGCEYKRKRWSENYIPRGPQMIEVPDDYKENIAFCSIECKFYYEDYERKLSYGRNY